jgi:hypothetical protein
VQLDLRLERVGVLGEALPVLVRGRPLPVALAEEELEVDQVHCALAA